MIEAFWASLDSERPSGDDPARVALALQRFFTDLEQHCQRARASRWRTELFLETAPRLETQLREVVTVCGELARTLPDARHSPQLETLRQLDQSIRGATFALEQEERGFGLPNLSSPQLMQFNYLFEGWKRGLLDSSPLAGFLKSFLGALDEATREVAKAQGSAAERESEQETLAVELAQQELEGLQKALLALRSKLSGAASACLSEVEQVLQHGSELARAFQMIEQCAPLAEPCPFCGGELSLSGRCRTCGRRLPHLEENVPEGEQAPIESNFRANNLRMVDLALLRWQREPTSDELWKEFQGAVRRFGQQVEEGRKEIEMLATAPDRPVASDSPDRIREQQLGEVAEAFNQAQISLSRFAFQTFPPSDNLPENWREGLFAAEARLQQLEKQLEPS